METKKNISVCCVVLPYKPLDNLELADAVNKLRVPAFRGVFYGILYRKKPEKKRMWYFKFR